MKPAIINIALDKPVNRRINRKSTDMTLNLNSLDRRRFLRGTGVALALPLFESVTTSLARAAVDSANPKRLACFYFPDGVPMPLPKDPAHKDWLWFPHGDGEKFTFTELMPAYRDFRDFYVEEYAPECRTGMPGVLATPRGEEYYAHRVKSITTTDMTPEQIRSEERRARKGCRSRWSPYP